MPTIKEISSNMSEERKDEIRQKFLEVDPVSYVVKTKQGLGFFEGLKADRESRKQVARQMSEIYVVMLEAQREMILQKCTLGLDLEKKNLFIQYVHEAEEKNQKMFKMSADIIAALNNILDQQIEQIDDMESEQLLRLEERKKSGKISEEKYNLRKQGLEERSAQQVKIIEANLERLIESHDKVFAQATAILRERVIGQSPI